MTDVTVFQGTYEYGKQLLQAALVLRRSLRYDVTPNTDRAHRLADAWKRFSLGINERASRLSVAAVFHRNADKVPVFFIRNLDRRFKKNSVSKS